MADETLDSFKMAMMRGKHQRRLSVTIARIDIGARTKLIFQAPSISLQRRALEFGPHGSHASSRGRALH